MVFFHCLFLFRKPGIKLGGKLGKVQFFKLGTDKAAHGFIRSFIRNVCLGNFNRSGRNVNTGQALFLDNVIVYQFRGLGVA